MKTKHNELYESPITEVVEVKQEGVICASGLRNSYGNRNAGIDPSELDEDDIWTW